MAEIKPLTGLRGLAALWIVAYHLLLPGALISGAAARIVGRGYLAVDVFFLLSGFVMALNYGSAFRGGPDPRAAGRFLWRRVARLYPIYGVILGGRLAYTAARYHGFALPRPWIAAPLPHPWTDIPANLLMVQSWGLAPSSIGPAWSVSTEWAAYWMFPLLAPAMLHRGRRAAWAGAAGAAVLIVATALLLAQSGARHRLLDAWDGETAGPIMRCFGGFALGIFLYRLSCWRPAARVASHPASAAVVGCALAWLLAMDAPDLAIYPAFAALVLCLACGQGWLARLLAAGLPVWLGEISYSLYLLHIFLLHPIDLARAGFGRLLPRGAADAVSIVAIFGLLLAAASISYRLVERPGRRLLRGWAGGPAGVQGAGRVAQI
jgi:peptidoglycan/LPS O-acetylase OafA/YrhL